MPWLALALAVLAVAGLSAALVARRAPAPAPAWARGCVEAEPADGGARRAATPPVDERALLESAQRLFVALQAATDAGDLATLERCTTPELHAALRLELRWRAGPVPHTELLRLELALVDATDLGSRQVASVHVHGLQRPGPQAAPAPFDEVWHFVRDAPRAEWAIAGIAPSL